MKLPTIEKSKIFSSKEKSLDSCLTDRINGPLDKRFVTRNLSFNQVMMSKKRDEIKQFQESRIISLREIHKKYVLI